jgi:hypothetical protein
MKTEKLEQDIHELRDVARTLNNQIKKVEAEANARINALQSRFNEAFMDFHGAVSILNNQIYKQSKNGCTCQEKLDNSQPNYLFFDNNLYIISDEDKVMVGHYLNSCYGCCNEGSLSNLAEAMERITDKYEPVKGLIEVYLPRKDEDDNPW